jgi:hypothetical protein
VAACVQEHVRQRIADFTRGPQDARVKPLGENRTSATERAVERARHAGPKRHHAAPECIRVGRLDEKMRVRGLQTVVHEPKVAAVAGLGKAPLESADEAHGA